jgi:hypothetical protein
MDRTPIQFQLTWLTSRPLLRGNRVAIALGAIPAALAILALLGSIRATEAHRGPILVSAALFISLSATLIQLPSFAGRIAVEEDVLTVMTPLGGQRGRLIIQRDVIQRAFYAPLERPPEWLPFVWAITELLLALAGGEAGWRGDDRQWHWLAAFGFGLSFWPLMAARWRAAMQVVILYEQPGAEQPGLILAWATPHEAGSLIHTLEGKIDWEPPPEPS